METKTKRWSREEVARKIIEFEEGVKNLSSQRQLAEELEIPRSTLQYWLERKNMIEVDPQVVFFF